MDNIALTGNNNVVSASLNDAYTGATGTAPTLTVLDTIAATGNSTGNVLNIVDTDAAGSALPTGISISGVQTVNLTASGVSGADDFSHFTGLTQLNVTESGGARGIVATDTTAVTLTDSAMAVTGIHVDGGSNVSIMSTGTDTGFNTFGDIVVGQATAPTGTVTINAAQTSDNANDTDFGNVNVTGGTTVAVSLTQNVGAEGYDAQAATGITVTGATGAVTVNNTMNVGDTNGDSLTGAAVNVTGGTTVVVNEVVTATTAANSVTAGLANATDGAVTILDGGTATSVTIDQTVTTAVAATAAVVAQPSSVTAGGPGFSSVTTAAVAAAPVVPGVMGVVANTVEISGAGTAQTYADASNTITSVTLDNYGANSFINSTVLTSLTLAGSGTDGLTVDNLGATPVTTLALNLNGFTDAAAFTDQHVTTLNVTTGGATASTLGSITDTSLTTLNVSGTQTFDLTSVPSSIKTLTVTGSAGFNGDISGTAITSFAPTSSGAITTTLNAAAQSFTGSTGKDVVTISVDATKVITGGSAAGNELILNGSAASFNTTAAHLTNTNVTGFTTLGVTENSTGPWDMSTLSSSFNAIDVTAAATALTASFTKVVAGTTLSLDGSNSGTISYATNDGNGANEAVTATIGAASNKNVIALSALTLEDGNGTGLGTVSFVSNDTATHAANTIVGAGLVDTGITDLNVSGTGGLTFGTSAYADHATSLTINNTETNATGVSFFGITDATLGNLTFTGSNATSITTLTDSAALLSINNTGSHAATIGTLAADANLTSLTLTGNVALNADGVGAAPAAAAATGALTGVTVSGATDNAHINFTLTGANAGATDNITVGNGNNYITDKSTAGNVNITVGTGSNLIDVHTGVGAGVYNITLGAHTAATGIDSILVSESGTFVTGTSANTVITGAVAGDSITFGAGAAVVTLTAAQQTAITGATTLTAAAALAFGDANAAGNVASFTYGGNTYVLEHTGAGAQVAADSLIELIGTHTINTTVSAGHAITLAS